MHRSKWKIHFLKSKSKRKTKKRSNFHEFFKKKIHVNEGYIFSTIHGQKIIPKENLHHNIYSQLYMQLESRTHNSNLLNLKTFFWMNSTSNLNITRSLKIKILFITVSQNRRKKCSCVGSALNLKFGPN